MFSPLNPNGGVCVFRHFADLGLQDPLLLIKLGLQDPLLLIKLGLQDPLLLIKLGLHGLFLSLQGDQLVGGLGDDAVLLPRARRLLH